MDAWDTLVNAALLGTEKTSADRAGFQALPGLAEAQLALEQRGGDSETRLLETAAVLYMYRRCGALPLSEKLTVDVAARESKPYCSKQAAAVLGDILQTGSIGLLQAWLDHCDKVGSIVTPLLIEPLLKIAAQHKSLRAIIAACCGKRGEWLSRQNPEWNFHTEGSDEERWDTGNLAERSEILLSVREKDPAAGRAMLEAIWAKEKADVKEALLQSLKPGLSEKDLPFLESISIDKSKRVQTVVFDFLTRLPESNIVKSFEEMLRPLITIQTTKKLLGLMSKSSLEIHLPKQLDNRLQDAIGKKPGSDTISDEEFCLLRMMSRVPPRFWESHLNLQPARILELFEDAAKDSLYRSVLREATIRFADRTWAPFFLNDAKIFLTGLLPLLSGTEQKAYLLSCTKTDPQGVIEYYTREGLEWPEDLAPLFIALVAANPYQYNKGFLNANAQLIPRSILPLLASIGPTEDTTANVYMKQYAAQMWQKTSEHFEHLRNLLVIKERTTAVFHNQEQ